MQEQTTNDSADDLANTVKHHVLEHHKKHSMMSFHVDDEHTEAVEALGEPAAGPLFHLMISMPFEATHFAYNLIPRIIDPPENIIERMNTEAISQVAEGFAGLSVPKMEEIYKAWGIQEGYIDESGALQEK